MDWDEIFMVSPYWANLEMILGPSSPGEGFPKLTQFNRWHAAEPPNLAQ